MPSSTSRRPVAGRRSTDRALPSIVRVFMVRRGPYRPRPGRPRGLGAVVPRLRRQGGRQRLPAVPPAPGADRAVGYGDAGGAPDSPNDRQPGPPLAYDRLLRSPRPRVRRLVPPARPLLPRTDPRRRMECRAGRRRHLARHPRLQGRDRGTRRRDRLVVATPRVARGVVAVRHVTRGARAGPRAARGASAARAPARPRRLGGAGSGGRRRVCRLLVEPRARRAVGRVPGPRSSMAEARRPGCLHGLA